MRRELWRATLGGYRRTALIGIASAGLLLGTFGTASGETAQTTAAPFSNGTAKATAVVARVAPGVGSLQLGISSGVAVAEIKNTIAQAQAESADLGLIGSTLTAENCHGGDAVISPEDLPQATRVDSRQGVASLSEDDLPIAGLTLSGGHKEVHAAPTPEASAVSKVLAADIPSLLTLDGGRAEATTRVIKGEAREAHAKVSVDLDIGGFLDLSALRWDAFHRTGKAPKATATFDVGTASILGVPIPTDSLTALETTLNSVLGSAGLTLTFPRVERLTTPADLIRITPLRLVLKDNPIGGATVGPLLNLSRQQREQLFDQLAASICDAAGALLVADIGVSIVSGTGVLAIEIGGAEAITGELVLESPFGGGQAPAQTIPDVLRPAVPTRLPDLPGPVAAPIANDAVQPTASIGPLEEHCQSTNALRRTACSKGALMAAGIVGLVATGGVGALDWQHQRRRRARLAVATPAGGSA
jgi:hypothetical protein